MHLLKNQNFQIINWGCKWKFHGQISGDDEDGCEREKKNEIDGLWLEEKKGWLWVMLLCLLRYRAFSLIFVWVTSIGGGLS